MENFIIVSRRAQNAQFFALCRCTNYYVADIVQELFDPVAFSDGTERDAETQAYINFTRLLNEAEGMYICHHK